MVDRLKYRTSELEEGRAADLLRILPKGRSTVLDAGAADGHYSRMLTQHFSSVTALDLLKPAFHYPGVVTVAGNLTKLQFPDASFDCVFCTEVLEHIPEVEKACRELVRVARHEVIVGVPYKQDTRVGRTTCRACGGVNPAWGHVNSFDEKRLLQLFGGLRMVSKSFVGTTRAKTNAISAALMDLAGNPWGYYDEDFGCVHCSARLSPPREDRTFGSRVCSWFAVRICRVQVWWAKEHPNWIHVVFSK